jgi:hypothetical protein
LRRAHTLKARGHAESLAPIITRLDPDGSLSLRALAAKLTAEGLPTPAGAAEWTAVTVARVKAKLAAGRLTEGRWADSSGARLSLPLDRRRRF